MDVFDSAVDSSLPFVCFSEHIEGCIRAEIAGTRNGETSAISAIRERDECPELLDEVLARHARREWGAVPAGAARLNDEAAARGGTVISLFPREDRPGAEALVVFTQTAIHSTTVTTLARLSVHLYFPVDPVGIDPDEQRILEQLDVCLPLLLFRHATGDWGRVPAELDEENRISVLRGGTVRSRYRMDEAIIEVKTQATGWAETARQRRVVLDRLSGETPCGTPRRREVERANSSWNPPECPGLGEAVTCHEKEARTRLSVRPAEHPTHSDHPRQDAPW